VRRVFVLLAVVLVVPLVALRGTVHAQDVTPSAQERAYPELRMVATDYAFDVAVATAAGLTVITLDNNGAEPHHAQLMRLAEGQTAETFQTAMGQGPEAIFSLGQFVGGPSAAEPGAQTQVILDLEPGQYLALCFVESPDGVPHLAKGMVQAFEVTDAGTPVAAVEPQAADTIVLRDFSFDLPTQVAAGPQLWEVVNEGPQPHEIALLQLAPGVTPDQLQGMLLGPPASPEAGHDMASPEASLAGSPTAGGPPPFHLVGGMQALAAGLRGWAVLDLEQGTYLAVCFVPDPASGQPHTALGMVASFTVE
jgi:hypothetical protein